MRKIIILLFTCVVLLSTGCVSQDISVENIYKEQKAQEEKNEIIQEDVSKKILDNMKDNAEKTISDISVKTDNAHKNTDYPDSADEMLDGVARSITDTIAYGIVVFMARLQKVAIWLCLGISLIGLAMIYINKRNPVGRRWSIFLTVMGPVLFFIIVYGPALYYSFIK